MLMGTNLFTQKVLLFLRIEKIRRQKKVNTRHAFYPSSQFLLQVLLVLLKNTVHINLKKIVIKVNEIDEELIFGGIELEKKEDIYYI